jgi:type I restriction enzyme M protein
MVWAAGIAVGRSPSPGDRLANLLYLASEQRGIKVTATKPSAWSSKRDGTLNQFYTRVDVTDVMLREISGLDVRSSVDLGAGEGALSLAVARAWPLAQITTVDIDLSCRDALVSRLEDAGIAHHLHVTADVLSTDIPLRLGAGSFDLAVCNPPFFRPEWQREFADILREADFAEACPSLAEVTAEILFLAQNLQLVRQGGCIALIVPDGLATGWRARSFRETLLRKHTLRCAIQLPPHSFHDTEAHCFIFVIEKGPPQGSAPVKLLRLFETGEVSDPVFVDPAQAEARLDWAYHAHCVGGETPHVTLRQLGADIRRGSLSTVDRRNADFPVFHTGDFPKVGDTVQLPDKQVMDTSKRLVIADPGDILVARVDRDLHNKITLVDSGSLPVTDCVYRIRVPNGQHEGVFRALTSDQGRAAIQSVTKGVGARLLGKGDLLDLPLHLTHHDGSRSIV